MGIRAFALYFVCIRNSTSLSKEERILRKGLIYGLVGLYLISVFASGESFSFYKNWKLLMYFLPVLYTLLIVDLLRARRIWKATVIPLFLFSLIAPSFQWVSNISDGKGVLTRDMSELHSSLKLSSYSDINVRLRPYYESMVVADILRNKHVYINSKTTMPPAVNNRACTLVDLRDGQYEQVQLINKTYGLIASSEKGCEIRNVTNNFLKVEINQKISFKSPSEDTRALTENWSSPELWGTWSIGEKARIQFRVNAPKSGDNWLNIIGTPFLNPAIGSAEVGISSPLFESKRIIFNSAKSNSIIRVKLKKDALLNSGGKVDIFLTTPQAVSPKSMGFSEDTRELGFGITSLELTDRDSK